MVCVERAARIRPAFMESGSARRRCGRRGVQRTHAAALVASWLLLLQHGARGSDVLPAALAKLGYSPPGSCVPSGVTPWPELEEPEVPPLPQGKRPNFIYVLIDDVGYDDLGVLHPRAANGQDSAGLETPSMDKMAKHGLSFLNAYTAPVCSQTRAQVLTGRDYARTGNVYNVYGFDAFALGEATAGDVMRRHGYRTAHFGKWHNGRTLGYEPWYRGFEESWMLDVQLHQDVILRHNGKYVQTDGLVEQVLADYLLHFLRARGDDSEPFFVYWAPFAVHWLHGGEGGYFAPKPYMRHYLSLRPPILEKTAQLFSFVQYFDDILGRVLDTVAENDHLRQTTYVMLSGDNGPRVGVKSSDDPFQRVRRMPSGMIGGKNQTPRELNISASEGGLRNHLLVYGPGVRSGAIDHTLLSLTDVLPTIAELAGANDSAHLPWSGVSFANLLAPGSSLRQEQQDRWLFSLAYCPHIREMLQSKLPLLGPKRRVRKPQPRLVYTDSDGTPVVKACIVGRHNDFKWLGNSNRVFRFANHSHVELPCNEVFGEIRDSWAAEFNWRARRWWESVIAEPNSFVKPTYQLGLPGGLVTNVEAVGAHELSGQVKLDQDAAQNLNEPGDGLCIKLNVATPGRYEVALMHLFKFPVTLELAVGPYDAIQAGTAATLQAWVPRTLELSTTLAGQLTLDAAPETEACVSVADSVGGRRMRVQGPVDLESSAQRRPAPSRSNRLANLQFTLLGEPGGGGDNATNSSSAGQLHGAPAGMPQSPVLEDGGPSATYTYLRPTLEMQELERHARAAGALATHRRGAVPGATPAEHGPMAPAEVWQRLRRRYGWVDGQRRFESLWSPSAARDFMPANED